MEGDGSKVAGCSAFEALKRSLDEVRRARWGAWAAWHASTRACRFLFTLLARAFVLDAALALGPPCRTAPLHLPRTHTCPAASPPPCPALPCQAYDSNRAPVTIGTHKAYMKDRCAASVVSAAWRVAPLQCGPPARGETPDGTAAPCGSLPPTECSEFSADVGKFLDYALAKPDVWVVTHQQLLDWMEAPVPASQMKTFMAQYDCDT